MGPHFRCLPEAALGVVCAPSPGVFQPMQHPLSTLPGPPSTWAHFPPAVWGLGFPSQAGEMSDADVSRVTPCRSQQCKQSWVPAPGVGLALVMAPLGSKMRGAFRTASTIRELKWSCFLPPTMDPFSLQVVGRACAAASRCPMDSFVRGFLGRTIKS